MRCRANDTDGAIDALRHRRTYARHEAPLEDVPEECESWFDSPAELVAERQQKSMLKRLLSRIPPLPRQLLFLSFVSGFSHQEIADHCGWTYTKVNRGVTEGRRSFLERYAGIEAGEECRRWAPTLSALVDGEASADDMKAVRPHLRNCAACRST